jgi:4-diphosphocytidyl-2-C-methyl-D-erythritol kinase
MNVIEERAFAKVNLCLLLGGWRDDGRHEIVTVFEAVDLADEVRISPAAADADEVVCAGVTGPNLVAEALATLRAAGWGAPPVRVEIEKRIPVAGGMGGGSADAAALLRAAPRLGEVEREVVSEIAARLGSDVPSQLDPGAALGVGAGHEVSPLPDLSEHALVVVPQDFGLSTAEVYREADQLSLARGAAELAALRHELQATLAARGVPGLVVNDLQPAAQMLRPEIAATLDAVREAGVEQALVCGSGPTVIGLAWGADAHARAAAAASRLHVQYAGAIAVRPVQRGDRAPAANP